MAGQQPGWYEFRETFTRFLAAPTRKAARQVLREHPELAKHGLEILDTMMRASRPPALRGPDGRLFTDGQARARLRVRRALLARGGRRSKVPFVVFAVLAIAVGVGTFLLVNRSAPVRFGPQVTLSPDGKLLASADNGHVLVWDVAGHRVLATLTVPGSSTDAQPAFSPDGKLLGAVSDDGNLYVWNVATRRRTAVFTDPGSGGEISGFAFSPDRRTLATFDSGDYVYLWDISHRRLLVTLAPFQVNSSDNNVLSGVAFSANGKLLAISLSPFGQSSSLPGAVIWAVVTHRIVGKLPPDTGGGGLAFSPDGAALALGDDFGNVTLWDLAGRAVARTLKDSANTGGGCYGLQEVVYSPDGTMLATDDGCANDSVLVWDPQSGQQTAVLSGQTRLGEDDLAFSRDSKMLFAGSSVGGVDRWDIGAATVTATFAEPSSG